MKRATKRAMSPAGIGEQVSQGVTAYFLRHAENASEEYGVDTRELLLDVGRRRLLGDHEEKIIDVALDLLRARRHPRLRAPPSRSTRAR